MWNVEIAFAERWFRNSRLSNTCLLASEGNYTTLGEKLTEGQTVWLWLPFYHTWIISSHANCPMIVRRSRNKERKNDASEILFGAILVSVSIISRTFFERFITIINRTVVIITYAMVIANLKQHRIDMCILIYPLFLFFNWKRQLNDND